jgi:shikimate kinase
MLSKDELLTISYNFPHAYEQVQDLHDALPPHYQNEKKIRELMTLFAQRQMSVYNYVDLLYQDKALKQAEEVATIEAQ